MVGSNDFELTMAGADTTGFTQGGFDANIAGDATVVKVEGAGAPKIGINASAATGTVVATITLRETATAGGSFTETVTINVTQNGAAGLTHLAVWVVLNKLVRVLY